MITNRLRLLLVLVLGLNVSSGAFPTQRAAAGTLDDAYHASWAMQSGYTTTPPGASSRFVVAFTNRGTHGWVRGEDAQSASLGTADPSDTLRWKAWRTTDWLAGDPNRVASQTTPWVGPGQLGWFETSFVVPPGTEAGVYTINLRPVIEGAVWLEDEGVYHQITVPFSARRASAPSGLNVSGSLLPLYGTTGVATFTAPGMTTVEIPFVTVNGTYNLFVPWESSSLLLSANALPKRDDIQVRIRVGEFEAEAADINAPPRSVPAPVCDDGKHVGNPHCTPSPRPSLSPSPTPAPTDPPDPSPPTTPTPTPAATPTVTPTPAPTATPTTTPTPAPTSPPDTTAPSSVASGGPSSPTSSLSWSFTASGTDNVALSSIALYVKTPGAVAYSPVESRPASGTSANVTFTAYVPTAGDGSYSFFTLARDLAGNVEAAPTTPDLTIVLNTAVRGVTLTPAIAGTNSAPGSNVCYQLTLHNSGNVSDTFNLTTSDNQSTAGYSTTLYASSDCSTTAQSSWSLAAGASASVYAKVHIAPNTADAWTAVPSMPTARYAPATALIGTKVYVIGGITGQRDTPNYANEVFDTSTQTWSSLAPIPAAFAGLFAPGATAVGSKIYVVGGVRGGGSPTTTAPVYDTVTGSWSTFNSSVAGWRPEAVALGNVIYVLENAHSNAGAASILRAYDTVTATWTLKSAPSPAVLCDGFLATVNGKIYLTGDAASCGGPPTHQVYDPQLDRWSALAAPAVAPAGWSAVVGGRVYSAWKYGAGAGTTEVFDPASGSWSSGAGMPSLQIGDSGQGVGADAYFIGGSSDLSTNTIVNTVQRYTPSGPPPTNTTTLTATSANDASVTASATETTVGQSYAGELSGSGALAAGGWHLCTRVSSGDARCWGKNNAGQVGIGNTNAVGDTPASVPIAIAVNLGGATVSQLSNGDEFSCALLSTGGVRCWGANWAGQLGLGNIAYVGDSAGSLPITADVALGGAKVIQIAVGADHVCALLVSGNVRCWGDNAVGQLGLGNTANVGDTPASVPITTDVNLGGAQVTQLSAGGDHTCAQLMNGNVRCWGDNQQGELGIGSTTRVGSTAGSLPITTDVNLNGASVIQIATGTYHSCALLATGNVRCWGFNNHGQLGVGSTVNVGTTPASLPLKTDVTLGGASVVKIFAGNYHTCALLATGNLRCWGYNGYGQLGIGTTTDVGDSAASLPIITDVKLASAAVTEVAAGAFFTCAALAGGSERCWGDDQFGEFGIGTASLVSVPDSRPTPLTDSVNLGGAKPAPAGWRYTPVGGSVCFPLSLSNTGSGSDTIGLTATNDNLPGGAWTTALYTEPTCTTPAPTSWTLASGAIVNLYAKVTAPAAGLMIGATNTTTFTAKVRNNTTSSGTATRQSTVQ